MINVQIDNQIDFKLNSEKISKAANSIFPVFGIPSGVLELIILGESQIQEINRHYRNIDKPTDVLSFPQIETPSPEKLLGSIVICPKITSENNESFEEVFIHGCLHIAGFDHETDQQSWDNALNKIT